MNNIYHFAIVTAPHRAEASWSFFAEVRKQLPFKSAAYAAADKIRAGAHIEPALGLRFQPFRIYDDKLYEVARVTAKGEVYYDEATRMLGQETGQLHYVLTAVLNAVTEVKQKQGNQKMREHTSLESWLKNGPGQPVRARVVITTIKDRWEVICSIFDEWAKQWEYVTGDTFRSEDDARQYALSWARHSESMGRVVEIEQ